MEISMMKHIRKLLICLLVLCLCVPFISSCSKQKEEIPDGMQLANVEGDLFRLYVPTTWKVNSGSGIASAYYTTLQTSSLTVTRIASDGKTVEAFYEACIADCKESFGDRFRVEATDVGTLGGEEGKIWVFTAWTEEDVNYKVLQLAVPHDGAYYLLTFAADPEIYERCFDDVQNIVKNFRFAEAYAPENAAKVLSDATAPAGMKTASTDQVPYRFFVPESWTIDMTCANAAAYYSDSDRSNVSVTVYVPDTDVVKLDTYYTYCMEEYRKNLGDLTLISCTKEDVTMGGRVAQIWEFTATVGGETYHYLQAVTTYNSLFHSAFYTVTYTATEENYAAHLSDVQAMIAAFTFR